MSHRSLPHFAGKEIATLDDHARVLWLFVYAGNCETDCHLSVAGVREVFSWMAPAEFDAALATLKDRGLMVGSEYEGELLLEAIDPSLADPRDQSLADHP